MEDLISQLSHVSKQVDVTVAKALWEHLLAKWQHEDAVTVYLQNFGGSHLQKWVMAFNVDIFTALMTTTGEHHFGKITQHGSKFHVMDCSPERNC